MTVLHLQKHGDSIISDFGYLFAGERLGVGIGREVYVLATDPTKVIKIEMASCSFQNAMEWEVWQVLKDSDAAKWLAPCRHISPSGNVLIQDRTAPLRQDELPERMPKWLTDFKRTNYGMINGRVVCHDYGRCNLIADGYSKRMKKVEWWEAGA